MTLAEAMAKAAKLLKLAESSNPHEAALAAQCAQEILIRYDIDQSALALDAGNAEPEEAIENFTNRSPLDEARVNLTLWKNILAGHIAAANSCKAYRSGNVIGIIGRASDVEKVRYLYAMLVREVDRLADRDGKGCGKSWRTAYRHGVVTAIGEKLSEARAKVVTEMRAEATGNALVRVNSAIANLERKDSALATWVRSNMRLRSSARRVSVSENAHQAGYVAGQSVNVGSARGSLVAGKKALPY